MADRSKSGVYAAIVEAGKKLGYELRAKQLEVVFKFVRGQDVFVSLPTGSGKSLCYSVLPRTFNRLRKRWKPSSLVIVVSPLVALMKNQVASLTAHAELNTGSQVFQLCKRIGSGGSM